MSEKEARRLLRDVRQHIHWGKIDQALLQPPDLVVLLQETRYILPEGAWGLLEDRIATRFRVRLTDEPPGWEYTDDQP